MDTQTLFPKVRYEVFSEGVSEYLSAKNMEDAVIEGTDWLAGGSYDTVDGETLIVDGQVKEFTTSLDSSGEEQEEETDSRYIEIEVEPDEMEVIRQQVGAYYMTCPGGEDKEGEHEWESTYEREGGCESNPGVWGGSGTKMIFNSHCIHCALEKEELHLGSQRNPGEGDRVSFSLCEDWDEKYGPKEALDD